MLTVEFFCGTLVVVVTLLVVVPLLFVGLVLLTVVVFLFVATVFDVLPEEFASILLFPSL